MSLNYVLPNGVTMGFGNEAERDAYLNSSAGAGAQTQQSAMAANPGQSMEQIKNQNHAAHYGVGGAGFGQAPLGSERNWGANQDKNQWIAQQTGYGGDFGGGNFNAWAGQNGVNAGQLEQQWSRRQAGPSGQAGLGQMPGGWGQALGDKLNNTMMGTGRDWGANQEKNQWIAQQTGYGGDFSKGGFNAWAGQNGVNGGALEQQWNQQQQASQPQTMGFGQADWGSMPGMQGLLGNFGVQAMGGPSSSNGWQGPSDGGWKATGAGPNMNYADAPSAQAMGGGAANTGHNMLWSW